MPALEPQNLTAGRERLQGRALQRPVSAASSKLQSCQNSLRL